MLGSGKVKRYQGIVPVGLIGALTAGLSYSKSLVSGTAEYVSVARNTLR